ncbi:hypothetical protein FRC12_024197 [Ceratobasidium sp. 428]|nr:hypothetical protein FRC12_024197 [Ceratobasidium sp. 428]
MPTTRCLHKPTPKPVVISLLVVLSSPHPVPTATSAAGSPVSAASTVYHSAASEPKTPINKSLAAKNSLPTLSTDSDVLTGYGTRNGETTVTVVGVPTHNGVVIQEEEHKESKSQQVPTDTIDNLLKYPAPCLPQMLNACTLPEAMQITHQKVVGAVKCNPNPLVWLTTLIAWTGTPVLDHALNNLKLSCYCLRLGNPYLIKKNCIWVDGKTPSKATLQWRDNAPNKQPDSEGDAVFGIIGMVLANGMSLNADCKWQVSEWYLLCILSMDELTHLGPASKGLKELVQTQPLCPPGNPRLLVQHP